MSPGPASEPESITVNPWKWNTCAFPTMQLNERPWLSEWAHHSDHDREPWDWQPEEEGRRCQDEAGNRDKGDTFSINLSKSVI